MELQSNQATDIITGKAKSNSNSKQQPKAKSDLMLYAPPLFLLRHDAEELWHPFWNCAMVIIRCLRRELYSFLLNAILSPFAEIRNQRTRNLLDWR
jgi:hypothetical protein